MTEPTRIQRASASPAWRGWRAFLFAVATATMLGGIGFGCSAAQLAPQGRVEADQWSKTALGFLERADQWLPADASERVRLVRLFTRLDASDRALNIAAALPLAKHRVAAQLTVAEILLRRNNSVLARKTQHGALDTLATQVPAADRKPLYLRALRDLSQEQFDGLWGPSSGHPAFRPFAVEARRAYAHVAAHRGDRSRAESLLGNPTSEGWLALAEAAATGGKRALARSWLDAAVSGALEGKLTASAISRAGAVALRVADKALATKLVERYGTLVSNDPRHSPYAALDIAVLAHNLGNTAHAVSITDDAYLAVRNDSVAMRARRLPYVAYVYARIGRPKMAGEALELALSTAGAAEPLRRLTVLRVAKGFAEIGDIQRARVLARDYDPTASAEVFIAVADHLLRKGERQPAIDALAEVVQALPPTLDTPHLPILIQLSSRYYRALHNSAARWALDSYVDVLKTMVRPPRRGALTLPLVQAIMQTRLAPAAY